MFEDSRTCPVGWSQWSLPHLQWALHEAALAGALSRGGDIFFDVDYSSEDGRSKLPDPRTEYSMMTVKTVYDSDVAGSPLFPFNNTVASMIAFIRAAVVSRRKAEFAVISQEGFVNLVKRPEPAKGDGTSGDADAADKEKSAAGHKRPRSYRKAVIADY